MDEQGKSVKCVRELRDIPFNAYRLDSDGRKWKKDCQQRRTLALELATYADANGTNIWPAIDTLSAKLGMSKRTIFRLLKDLEKLLALSSRGLSRYHGTRKRELHLAALELNLYVREHYTENPEHQDFMAALREEERKIGMQDFMAALCAEERKIGVLTLAEEPGVVEISRRAKESNG